MSSTSAREAVATFEAGVAALLAVDPSDWSPQDLADGLPRWKRALSAAEAGLGRMIVTADTVGIGRTAGHRDASAWLAAATGGAAGRLRTAVVVGEAMAASDKLTQAVTRGDLPVESAAALAPAVAHRDFAAEGAALITAAAGAAIGDVQHATARWLAEHTDGDGEDPDQVLRRRRRMCLTRLPDRMGRIDGVLDPVGYARVRARLDAIVQQTLNDGTERSYDQRMADALVEVCTDTRAADGVGGRRSASVLVTVAYEVLFEQVNGVAYTATGDVITAETARKLACDASLHRVITVGGSTIADFGTATRFASPSQYKMLVARDRHCRYPGCTTPASRCDVHHIRLHSHGGPTNLNDLALICGTHHDVIHTTGWQMTGNGQQIEITRPDGTTHTSRPPSATGPPTGEGPPAGAGPLGTHPSGTVEQLSLVG